MIEEGTFRHINELATPFKVTLSRGQKGTYGWEITVYAETTLGLLDCLRQMDAMLRFEYGPPPEEKAE